MIILKTTKMGNLTFTLENTFFEKPDEVEGGGRVEQIDSPAAFLGLNSINETRGRHSVVTWRTYLSFKFLLTAFFTYFW